MARPPTTEADDEAETEGESAPEEDAADSPHEAEIVSLDRFRK